ALTEPLPYVGVDTSMLCGRIRVVEMDSKLPDGPGENIPPEKQPIIQVDKRGRFITGMGFAKFVTAAVETDDPKIKSSCMIILEETDPGTFDRGIATKKLVHQLSSTNDPVFNLRVPASRIIGGYTIQNGQIVPNYTHGEVIEAVFRRTRITVGLMTTAKLLSAIEPVIRYQRQRFRGGASVHPGSPRHDLGLQQKEDSLHRLVDIWAAGEASASLGFAAARLFDDFDPLEKRKEEYCQKENLRGRNQLRALMKATPQALDYVKVCLDPNASQSKKDQLKNNVLVEFMAQEALASVLCPACKLWNTGHGANIMREAVSLMGGYGITEDCPGFLGNKWMDAQLEATYEGPEAVQRRQLSVTMTSEIFLTYYNVWINDLKKIHNERNNLGAEIVAKSMDLWRFTLNFLQNTKDATGNDLYHGTRQGVAFPMADALCWTLASHLQIMDTVELAEKGPQSPTLAEGLEGFVNFFSDLCQVQAIATAGKVTQTCNELVYGYINAKDPKLAQFDKLKSDLDHSLLGSRLAKDRAAQALTQVMIPEALDYPL
ncbi:MAG: acyl-CoA dehydrogenase family protein, partial [Pseudomonadota bacterium]